MQGIGFKDIERAEGAKRGRSYPESSNCRKLLLLFGLEPQNRKKHWAQVCSTVTPVAAAAEQDSRSRSPADATGDCGHRQPYASAAVTSGPTLIGTHTCLLEPQIEPGAIKKNQSGLMLPIDRIEEELKGDSGKGRVCRHHVEYAERSEWDRTKAYPASSVLHKEMWMQGRTNKAYVVESKLQLIDVQQYYGPLRKKHATPPVQSWSILYF